MALTQGDKAPDFTLKNTQGEQVSLQDYQGSQNVVLLFFPLAFSSVCTDELCHMRDNLKDYEKLDAEVAGISVDSFYALREFKKQQNLNFTLLSDFNKEACNSYGAKHEDLFGYKGVAKRSAFVVDKQRKIAYAEVLDDPGSLPDFEKIQSTLKSL